MAECLFYTQKMKVRVFHCPYIKFLKILYMFKIFFLYLILIILIGFAVYMISYFLILRTSNLEKNLPYECGFLPFDDTRGVFEIEFYLVSILFIIFDLEIIFLFPWILVVSHLTFFGILIMLIFIFLLVLVFFYELIQGVLDW